MAGSSSASTNSPPIAQPARHWLADPDLHFAVIGAGGWLGHATLDLLGTALGDAAPQRLHAFGSYSRDIALRGGRPFPVRKLESLNELPRGKRHVLLHYAFLTKDKVATHTPAEFISGNRAISDAVADALRGRDIAGLFLPSSGAVYRKDRTLDSDLEANPYGVLKVQDEVRFTQLSEQHGFPLALVRVFNLAGPYINKVGTYALSSIIGDVLRGGPVKLRADRPVIRSYVSVLDVINLALCMLSDKSRPAGAIDTAGEREVEVGELARLCGEVLGNPTIKIERPEPSGKAADRYVGDGREMHARAARYGIALASLSDQIRATATFLSEGK
ncbi:MAG: NAD(P)-dependent oxidoreductase [Pseudolabrys sp.]|nr:NAD(P)-dependent oxidoreductase [Pseudolabrys sp.]